MLNVYQSDLQYNRIVMNDERKEMLEGVVLTNSNACCYLEDASEVVDTVYCTVLS
jgi:hypothetical protein